MDDYKPFAISNFRTGFNESVEPWLLPRDAYQTMVNAHLYRGVLEKIDGYRLFARMTNRSQIVMTPAPDGVTTTFIVVLPSAPTSTNFFGYGTTIVGSSAETFSYDGDQSATVIDLLGSSGGDGTVDLATNTVTLNFAVAPPAGTYSTVFFEWDAAPAVKTAIMGIKQYFNSNGGQSVLVFDQKRGGIIQSNFGILAAPPNALQTVVEVPHDYYQSAVVTGTGAMTTFSGTLAGKNFVPGTVRFLQFTSVGVPINPVPPNTQIIDNGFGGLQGNNVDPALSFINYTTGAYTITFLVAPASGNVFDVTVGVYGDLFTGSISDFFSLYNYLYKAFFANNVDQIMYYDGIAFRYLNPVLAPKLITATAGVPTNEDITTCLHVFVNRERLLLISPTVEGIEEVFGVWWSVAGAPLDFTNEEFLRASTSEPIRTIGFINSDLVIRFAASERVFRYTGDAFSPFRFDSTNNLWACDASYSAINYDSWFSSVGRPAIVGSDAVNVVRADEVIPDFTDPTRLSQQTPVPFMSQTSIRQCYGERFDDIKEGWLCYNSGPVDQSQVTASDHVLSFNYMDKTYSIYAFPFSCLGYGRIINVPTWGTIFEEWQNMSDTWDSYELQSNALIDLAGDQYDCVYELNSGNTLTVPGDPTTTPVPVLFDVITKNFNPFIEDGELCRLGYVDLFVSAYSTSTLRVQFFVNDQLYVDGNDEIAGYYQENIITFDSMDAMSPTNNQTKVWKRIYVGAVGKEHTVRFYQNIDDFETTDEQPVYIHSMVLYMKPAGRIFN